MKVLRTPLVFATAVLALAATSVALPTAAYATSSTLWVAHAPTVTGNGSSCTKPGFNTIQAALDAGGSKANIRVCGGTYAEQLTITKSVTVKADGPVTVQLPVAPVDSTTTCLTPFAGAHPQSGIEVCTSGSVSLTGLTIHAAWAPGNCNEALYGVFVGGGAKFKGTNLAITAAGAVPLDGCQHGVGIQVGRNLWTQVGHANLKNVDVSGYQKNGITVDGPVSTATIVKSMVTGAGATNQIAQNGIQISRGAVGKLTDVAVSGNECGVAGCGPDTLSQDAAAGVLFYASGAGSRVTNSTFSNNDMGVYVLADPAKPAPTKATTSVVSSHFNNNRYEQIVLDQGNATLSADTITGTAPAIQVLQYTGQTFGAVGSASGMKISGTATAVQVHSDSSNADVAGKFTITGSSLGGGAVVNENPANFTITQSGNTP